MFKYVTQEGETVHVVARSGYMLSVVDSNGYLKIIDLPYWFHLSIRYFKLPSSILLKGRSNKEACQEARRYKKSEFSYSVSYSNSFLSGTSNKHSKKFTNLKKAVNYTAYVLSRYNAVRLDQDTVTFDDVLIGHYFTTLFCSNSKSPIPRTCTNISPKTLRKIRKKLSEVSKGINNV